MINNASKVMLTTIKNILQTQTEFIISEEQENIKKSKYL